jgi:hypothetical protein
MNTIAISFAVFGCVFGGALLGMLLRRSMPRDYPGEISVDIMKLVTGLIITMVALVLGMLVSSSKAAYDTQKNELSQMCAQIVLLDRVLAKYGPETTDSRLQLKDLVSSSLWRVWAERGSHPAQLTPPEQAELFFDEVLALSPKNQDQAMNKQEAVRMATDLRQARWLMFVGSERVSVPVPVLVVLVAWLIAIFLIFGFLAPPNATMITTLILCALAASGAIFIILALNAPFEGILRISDAPLRAVLSEIGK